MLESRSDFEALLTALLPAVLEAGRITLSHFEKGVTVERKADQSPVTEADRQAEAVILEALARSVPDVPVLAEEEASAGRIPQVGDRLFLVDPLDGTRAFVSGREAFTVNVGLALGGIARFGIIYAPALKRLFATRAPGQAVEISGDAAISTDVAALDKARVLQAGGPAAAQLRIATSRYVSERLEARLSKLPPHTRINIDSSIKFCLVARGEADIYPRFGPINEWDTAAGHAILAAAGGCMTNLAGRRVTYGHAERNFLHEPFIAWRTSEPTEVLTRLREAAQ